MGRLVLVSVFLPWLFESRRCGALGPAGLAHFGAQSVSIFFNAKYASTLICILPKPPTRTAYINPEATVIEESDPESIQRRVSEIHSS